MIQKKGKCSGECGCDDVYIVNRKHMLCNRCNYIRINGSNAITEKQEKNSLKRSKIKRSGNIKQKSRNQISLDSVYNDTKRELIKELKEDGKYYCKGCGNPNNLSLSHLVRRSRDSSLTAVKENMTIHCLVRPDGSRGCHDMWETISEMWKLHDFDDNMSVIRRLDPEFYWIVIGKLREAGLEIDTDLHKQK